MISKDIVTLTVLHALLSKSTNANNDDILILRANRIADKLLSLLEAENDDKNKSKKP